MKDAAYTLFLIGATIVRPTTVTRRHWPVAVVVATLALAAVQVFALSSAVAEDLNVRSYGAIGDGLTDDGPAIQKAIDAAIETGRPSQIVIPAGHYLLGRDFARGSAQLVIEHAHNLSISGLPGAWLVSAAPQRSFFAIAHSSDVRVGGLTLDRKPFLFAQGAIQAVDPHNKTVLMSTNLTDEALDSALLAANKWVLVFGNLGSGSWGDHSAACAFYKPGDPSVCWPPMITGRKEVGPHLWELWLNAPPQANDLGEPAIVWSGVYKGRAFLIHYSRDVTIHNLTYFAEGDEGGFIINHASGIIKFDHFTVGIPPGSGHLIGSAGGAMVFNNHIHLILDHVNMSASWDDSVNMGANFARIYAQLSPSVLQVDGSRADFVVGDHLSVWDWPRKTVIARVRITAISCWKKPNVMCQLTLDHAVKVTHPGYAPVRSEGNDTDGIDRLIDLDGVGSLTITNSSFQSLHARCLLIKASHSLVENSLCHDTVMAGIIIGPGFFWDEGPEVKDVTIRDNIFKNVSGPNILVQNGGSPTAPAITGITITGNQFLDYGRFRHGVDVGSGVPILLQKTTNPSLSRNRMSTHFTGLGLRTVEVINDTLQIK